MTSEIRTMIEPKDIKAIELECGKCHASTRRQIDNWLQDSSSCPNCGDVWLHINSPELNEIKTLVMLIRGLATRTSNKHLPFNIRFDISGTVSEKRTGNE
jgi:hypothetical protein